MEGKITKKEELELMSIGDNDYSLVKNPKGKGFFKIGYRKMYTTERITKELLKSESVPNETEADLYLSMMSKGKFLYKAASYILLNNYFKIKFFHSLYWRYLCYIKQYSQDTLLSIFTEGKKKMEAITYGINIAVLGSMVMTKMEMTRKEHEQYHQELILAQEQLSEKGTPGL